VLISGVAIIQALSTNAIKLTLAPAGSHRNSIDDASASFRRRPPTRGACSNQLKVGSRRRRFTYLRVSDACRADRRLEKCYYDNRFSAAALGWRMELVVSLVNGIERRPLRLSDALHTSTNIAVALARSSYLLNTAALTTTTTTESPRCSLPPRDDCSAQML